MKASDIGDRELLEAVAANLASHGQWAHRWDIHDAMPEYPPKVVSAKLARLVKRGLLTGCAGCNDCRGDFNLTDAGKELLALERA